MINDSARKQPNKSRRYDIQNNGHGHFVKKESWKQTYNKNQLTNHHHHQQKGLTSYNVQYSSGLDTDLDKPVVKDIVEPIREIWI